MSSPTPTTFTNVVWLLITLLLAAGTAATVWLDNWRWAVTALIAAGVVFTTAAVVHGVLQNRRPRQRSPLIRIEPEWLVDQGGPL